MHILFDTRWIGNHGIGRFAAELFRRLPGVEPLPAGPRKLSPTDPIWLTRTITRLHPDLYFSPGFNPPLRSSVPFVFTIHDLIHLKVAAERNLVKQVYYELVVKRATHRAARVVTISEFSRRRITEWAGIPEGQASVIGVGVSAIFNPDGPRRQHRKPYLLFVGNSKPHKNLGRLLEAFAISRLSNDVDFILCAPDEPATSGLIRQFGLDDSITVTGLLSDEALAECYRGALALIFPTLHEGFGLPALEAMACGTPVLTSSLTSLPEVTGDAALIVNPYDVEAIAAGMQRLVEDTNLVAELKQHGLARAKLFSWDDVAGRLMKVFTETVGKR